MDEGFIYLHRKLKNHWIWKNVNYFQWFVHLIFRANFKDTKILIGSELINVKRGEFITSIDNLSNELNNCSPQKIRTFLKLLEKDSMIIRKSTSKLTKIYICNYDSYQNGQQTNNKPITNEQQTSNKRSTTENKDNKEIIKKNKDNNYPDFFNQNLISIYNEFLQFRKEKKAPITKTQEQRFFSKLGNLSNHDPTKAEKILIQSIENGWRGIFELKTDKKNNNPIIQKDQSDFSKKDDGWN